METAVTDDRTPLDEHYFKRPRAQLLKSVTQALSPKTFTKGGEEWLSKYPSISLSQFDPFEDAQLFIEMVCDLECIGARAKGASPKAGLGYLNRRLWVNVAAEPRSTHNDLSFTVTITDTVTGQTFSGAGGRHLWRALGVSLCCWAVSAGRLNKPNLRRRGSRSVDTSLVTDVVDMVLTPNPGTNEALVAGCACPFTENMGKDTDFVTSPACTLHEEVA